MQRDHKGRFIKGHKQLNTGKSHFKKGVKVRLGAKHTEESKAKMSKARKGTMPTNIEFLRNYPTPAGENSHLWKGDQVGYSALHKWVYRVKGKANRCRRCKNEKFIDWANISRQYKRDKDDWIELCRKCHKEYDTKHKELEQFLDSQEDRLEEGLSGYLEPSTQGHDNGPTVEA